MTKCKNKDAAKRREAKKRRKVIKRRVQVHSKNIRIIPAEYVSTNKLSEVVLAYAEPLINAVGDNEERAIRFSVTLWKCVFIAKTKSTGDNRALIR